MIQTKMMEPHNKQIIQYYTPVQVGPPSGQDPFLDT